MLEDLKSEYSVVLVDNDRSKTHGRLALRFNIANYKNEPKTIKTKREEGIFPPFYRIF